MRISPPDAYWKKDVALFFGKRFALAIKMLYPLAIIGPVAASDIPAQYAAAVIGIVAIMAGTFAGIEVVTEFVIASTAHRIRPWLQRGAGDLDRGLLSDRPRSHGIPDPGRRTKAGGHGASDPDCARTSRKFRDRFPR